MNRKWEYKDDRDVGLYIDHCVLILMMGLLMMSMMSSSADRMVIVIVMIDTI